MIKDLTDVIEHLNNQVQVAQENITECQANVMQIEETKAGYIISKNSNTEYQTNIKQMDKMKASYIKNLTLLVIDYNIFCNPES